MTRKVIYPEGKKAIYEDYGYSPAILSDKFLFVSGQVGVRDDGTTVEDPADQIKQAFENLQSILTAAGATFDDVVDVTTFHVDYKEHGQLLGPVKRKYFVNKPDPNWTAIGVSSLADRFLFEIKVIVRIPD